MPINLYRAYGRRNSTKILAAQIDADEVIFPICKENTAPVFHQKLNRIVRLLTERWNSPALTGLLHLRSDCQYELLFPGAANNLHAYRQAFGRVAHRDHGRRIDEQVEPLGITPRVQILNSLAIKGPASFSVAKSGDRRRGTKQNRVLPHLHENFSAQRIPTKPGLEQQVT